MSERNKKTPWDEELEAEVLADERAKRKQALGDQLDAFDALSTAQPAPPPTSPAEDRLTFSTEDAAVSHFESQFASSHEPEGLWQRLEGYFGAKELRIYLGSAMLILVVLLFSLWFNSLATQKVKARAAANQQTAGQDAAVSDEAAEAAE